MGFRGVIFDLGGVVLGSPLQAIARFEADQDLPVGLVARVVGETGPTGAWSRLERGELSVPDFCPAFEAECRAAGHALDATAMMHRIAASTAPRPAMLQAIRNLRAHQIATAALTNNWVGEEDGTRVLRDHFDVFVESCTLGMRKPDPRIYLHTCERLAVEPREAVFLDDIGQNLKSARALGMHTLKVEDPDVALEALAAVMGIPLHES